MKKKWIGLAVTLSLCVGLLAPMSKSEAAGDQAVRVTIPKFSVKLNGQIVESQYREYPLLVYNDITYFPMTWYDSRMLGLEAGWSQDDGLRINQARVTSSYVNYASATRNGQTYTAGVPASAITVNGKPVDNAQEEYPLLSFRDVTYFPLTWRFAHDEFGWDYEWSESDGLSIQSHNPQLQALDLPLYAGENDAAEYKGYYYFVETTDTTNHVYRAPIDHPSDKEQIYSYNIESGYGLQKGLFFQIRDDGFWFWYHLGGATMGHDEFVKVNDDGTTELRYTGYLNSRSTPYGDLIINQGNPPFAGNLALVEPGQPFHEGKRVGQSGMMYGRHVTVTDSSVGVGGDGGSTTVIGDNVYITSTRYGNENTDLNRIYRINLKTNESVKLVDASVSWFRIIGDTLYYVKDEDGMLYASGLDGSGERKVSDFGEVTWIGKIDDNLFYTTSTETYGKVQLYQMVPDGEDALVLREPLSQVSIWNNKELVCLMSEGADYGMKLLDGSGRLLLAVADPVNRLLSSDDALLVTTTRDTAIYALH